MLALFADTAVSAGRIIRADTPDHVQAALNDLQKSLDAGETAIGFFGYELGYLLDPVLKPLYRQPSTPLLWFAIGQPARIDLSGNYSMGPVNPHWNRRTYVKNCEKVIDNIKAGEIYQANLTLRASFDFTGNPRALFRDLSARQPTQYSAYIEADDFSILSLSPELFISLKNKKIITKPMKGTLPGSADIEDLRNDPKQRAENLMIVDLMRNDLGRIGKNVRVEEMFAIETHPTLHQMTSTVSAETNADLKTLLAGLFPAGSITGAPKIRAMQIIRDLEDTPRGVYCGAIGMLKKDEMLLNVAIRTVTIQNGKGTIGIGSGVVADSIPADEYDECLLKMKFLEAPFGLIETFARKDGRYAYYAEHMSRLAYSASAFGFQINMQKIENDLKDRPDGMIRLVVQKDGDYTITAKPLPATSHMRARISKIKLDSGNPYLRHKTTMRALYDQALADNQDVDEVIFLNERGELCEGARTNIFIEGPDGVFLTPPLSSGLLPGTLRARLLATGKAREQILFESALQSPLFLGNGVRGMLPATVVI